MVELMARGPVASASLCVLSDGVFVATGGPVRVVRNTLDEIEAASLVHRDRDAMARRIVSDLLGAGFNLNPET